MYILNITDDYDNITFANCTNIEDQDDNIFFEVLLLSIPSSIILFFPINFM